MHLYHYLRKFCQNTSGQISVIAGLSVVPLIGALGLGVDYSFIATQKTALQAEADVAALERRGGEWLSPTVYRVHKSGRVNTYFMGIFGQKAITIDVIAEAYLRDPVYSFSPPVFKNLDGGALDYNTIGFYCLDPKTNERSNFNRVSDNRGNTYKISQRQCKEEEQMHYYLENYSHYEYNETSKTETLADGSVVTSYSSSMSRTYLNSTCSPQEDSRCTTKIMLSDDAPKPSTYEGKDLYKAALETVVCDTLERCFKTKCKNGDAVDCLNYRDIGGKIPKGTHRTPLDERHLCAPGKYIYYGWEDTIDGVGMWEGDKDYDDAAMIISCPEFDTIEGKSVYLRR